MIVRNKTKTEASLTLPLFLPGSNSLIFTCFFLPPCLPSSPWGKGVAAHPPPPPSSLALVSDATLLSWLFFLIVFFHSCCTAVLSFIKYVITEAPQEPAGASMVQPQPLLSKATPQEWLWPWRNQQHWTHNGCKYWYCCDSGLKLFILLGFAQIELKLFISILIVFISIQ